MKLYNPMRLLKFFFTEHEPITIEEVGPADIFGYAAVKLSNGRYTWSNKPLVGRTVGTWVHDPRVEPLYELDGWRIRTLDGTERIILSSELRDMLKESESKK